VSTLRKLVLDCVVLGVACLAAAPECGAQEDIEFVAEHLPEVSIDNRYASLPIWAMAREADDSPVIEVQVAWSGSSSAGLTIGGPLLSVGISNTFRDGWRWGAFGFYDRLKLQASQDERPLQTLFSPATPIERPVAARFFNLDGRSIDYGAGAFAAQARESSWLGPYEWTAGALWQRVTLRDYRLAYEILEGPQRGISGQIDFDAHYTFVAPFVGAQLPRTMGRWRLSPHALLVIPLQRRAFAGHITGPGFDFRGDAGQSGVGKNFNDVCLTLGATFLFEPLHLSIDLGAFATQALLERRVHPGIDRNYLISIAWLH